MSWSQRLVVRYIRTKFSILSLLSKRKAGEQAFELFCTPQYRNKKKLPPIFLKAEILKLNFAQYKIRGYRWNVGAPKKILILHGFESSVVNFDRYVQPLIKKGYEVLAFDAPAHGRSSGKQIHILLYRDLINFLQKEFGPIHHFLAHSLGGLALSLTIEEWKHNENCRIVLIAPATETPTAIDSFFKFLKLNGAVRKEFEKKIEQISGYPPQWFSINRAAKNIRAQVLWIHDKDDDMTPLSDVTPTIEKNYPNFRFLITEGLGHRRIYRDNKVSRAVIDFLP